MKTLFNSTVRRIIVRKWGGLGAVLASLAVSLGGAARAADPLDPSFDHDGRLTTKVLSGKDDVCNKVLLQRDGKIVAVGSPNFILVRYNADGSLDTGFGQGGKVTETFFDELNQPISNAYATDAALQSDGKIVVVGYVHFEDYYNDASMRFNTDGSLDNSYGVGGRVINRAQVDSWARAVGIQPNGKIVVGGVSESTFGQNFFVSRFKPDGSPDPFAVQPPPGDAEGGGQAGFNAVVALPGGKVLLAGAGGIVMRVNDDGTADTTFGTNGIAATPLARVDDMVSLPNGKVAVTGPHNAIGGNFNVVRLNANGTLDSSFGSNGLATSDFGGLDSSNSLARLSGERLVAAGNTTANGKLDFAIAVFNTDGAPDLSFGNRGQATRPFGASAGNNAAWSVAVQPDNRIVVGGYADNTSNADADFALVRYIGEIPRKTISIADTQIFEGGDNNVMAFTVSLSSPSSQTVTVQYATATGSYQAATPSLDFKAQPPTTLTFAPGQIRKIIAVPIFDDQLFEDTETFSVELSSPTNATLADRTGVGTIFDNEPLPTATITGQTVIEGNSGSTPITFTIRLSEFSSKPVQVQYKTANDTAMSGSDYVEVPRTTVTFAPGETVKQVTTQVKSDTMVELDERFMVNFVGGYNVTWGLGRAYGIIINDDGPGLSIDNASAIDEGNSGSKAQVFTVHLSAASPHSVSVSYATAPNTANAADFVATSSTLTFAPGETTKTITVLVKGDTTVEPTETYRVNLSAPTYAVLTDSQAVGYIRNDDVAALLGGDEPSS